MSGCGKIWGENAAADFGRQAMRNDNLKRSNNDKEKSVNGRRRGSFTPSRNRDSATRTPRSALRAEKMPRENSELIECLKADPVLERLFSKGIRLTLAGKPKDAVSVLEKAASQFPREAPLL